MGSCVWAELAAPAPGHSPGRKALRPQHLRDQAARPPQSARNPQGPSAQNHTVPSSHDKRHGQCQRALYARIPRISRKGRDWDRLLTQFSQEGRSDKPEPSFPAQLLTWFGP